eukprot:TRINITY_DN6442_c0_g1_i6.p1 TRINITY_DN6442_c0_g1~~TRINITY_DN6442_c0_g1_i6.p1  ORF type:complete len:202 (+),score=61.54 TRINITY_DN6442_c0_g1_i6:233-838(+)
MEEQFILRVPPSIAERLNRVLNENPLNSEDTSIDLSFSQDGRTGTFVVGNDHFPVSLLDLPCIVESYKSYDDSMLIKTADVGQMIMVREEGEPPPEGPEYRHGLTPPMRDARRRRFRREPDLNPEIVQRVEKDLLSIMAGGTALNVDVEVVEQEEDVDEKEGGKLATQPPAKSNAQEAELNDDVEMNDAGRTESDDSEESL